MTTTDRLLAVSPDGVFAGYAALFSKPDLGNDIIEPGAFRASIRARGGAEGLRVLFMHDPREPIGVLTDIAEDGRGLLVRGRLTPGVKRAEEAYALLKSGALDGLSIGFKPVTARRDPRTGARRLLAIDLWEVSLVTFPLMPGARVFRMPALPVLDAKYSPDQPRVPAGNREGGQWTADGSGTPKRERDEDGKPRSARGDGADAKPSPAKDPSAGRDLSDTQTRDSGVTRDLVDRPEKIESPKDEGSDEQRSKDGAVEETQSRRGGSPPGSQSGSQQQNQPNNRPTRGGRVDLSNPKDAVPNHSLTRHAHNSEAELRRRMENAVRIGEGRERQLQFSTFDSEQRANHFVNRALDASANEIVRWNGRNGTTRAFDHFPGEETGLILERDADGVSERLYRGDGVRVVLLRDTSAIRGWLVLTAYVLPGTRGRGGR